MSLVLQVDPDQPEEAAIARAAGEIRAGGLVAFPTETVYGLGGDGFNEEALEKIFAAKERPKTDPLILHLAAAGQLELVVGSVPALAHELADAFWPGPLTLILPKAERVSTLVTAGRDTVAVRVPDHPVALALLKASGVPIAAPSANRFSQTSPTKAEHVARQLGERVNLILDAGPTRIGIESTVLDLTSSPPRILRPGGLTREKLETLTGPLEFPALKVDAGEALPSPGLFARHYAPRARLILFAGNATRALEQLAMMAGEQSARGARLGLLLTEEELAHCRHLQADRVSLGALDDLASQARKLYAGLQQLDALGVDLILTRTTAASGLGAAINDRLAKAAADVISADENLPAAPD